MSLANQGLVRDSLLKNYCHPRGDCYWLFCGMYTLVDMLQCRGRAALRVKAEKGDCYWLGTNIYI